MVVHLTFELMAHLVESFVYGSGGYPEQTRRRGHNAAQSFRKRCSSQLQANKNRPNILCNYFSILREVARSDSGAAAAFKRLALAKCSGQRASWILSHYFRKTVSWKYDAHPKLLFDNVMK
jgi:hypothetical protein